jgi:hypothetical protein
MKNLMFDPTLKTAISPLLGAALLLWCVGCGNAQVTDAPPPPRAPKVVAAPAGPNAYADHSGPHAAIGETFRLKDTAVAVDGAEIVIGLIKASWTERELPDGRKILGGAAELKVSKGTETNRPILELDESTIAHGYRITVKGAGQDYDEKRLDYLPWVELVVEAVE